MSGGMVPMPLPREVHVWIAWSDAHLGSLPKLERSLSRDELGRASSFCFMEHQFAYVFAHGVLRDVLSRYVGARPEDIAFGRGKFGKPYLIVGGCEAFPAFSLSHSAEAVLVALAREGRIGADIEEVRPFEDFRLVAKLNFTTDEYASLMSQAPDSQLEAFFQYWTRKEAYVKAKGDGLTIPLNSIDTTMGAANATGWLCCSTDENTGEFGLIADLQLPPGYMGAVASLTAFERLVYFDWTPA
jgi:4'-phosphopantetheinyl transferase